MPAAVRVLVGNLVKRGVQQPTEEEMAECITQHHRVITDLQTPEEVAEAVQKHLYLALAVQAL